MAPMGGDLGLFRGMLLPAQAPVLLLAGVDCRVLGWEPSTLTLLLLPTLLGASR